MKKKKNNKSLNLEKFRISKLNHSKAILGGGLSQFCNVLEVKLTETKGLPDTKTEPGKDDPRPAQI